jgi:hypothetical protein
MGILVSKSNKDFINENWNELKCSPLGPFLQMIGIAPGDAKSTSDSCKSSEFSSQFNSSMSEHINITSQLTGQLNFVQETMDKFRTMIASMEQRAFEDLSKIATIIFALYIKIGNILYVMMKNLTRIMDIFKASVNFGASITKLLISFINLLKQPVNGFIDLSNFFKRG